MVSGRRGEAGAHARKPVGVESRPEHAPVLIQHHNTEAVIVRVSHPQHRRAIRITALVRFVHVHIKYQFGNNLIGHIMKPHKALGAFWKKMITYQHRFEMLLYIPINIQKWHFIYYIYPLESMLHFFRK